MRHKTVFTFLAGLAAVAVFASAATAATTTVRVDENGDAGWQFNRDPNNTTPYEFSLDQASLGSGSLYVEPIGANAADKFTADLDVNSVLDSVTFDYFIENGSNDHVYLNLYTNTPATAAANPANFYECRYDYTATGTAGSWQTVSTENITPAVVKRGTYAGVCPATPDEMVTRAVVLNWGQSSASDVGASGYLDNVQVAIGADITIYDFEVKPSVKDACKDGGHADYGYASQGECVSALQANDNAGK